MEEINPIEELNIKRKLPESDGALVLGILSIVFCCCLYGLIGAILGIVSLVLAKKGNKLYNNSPTSYTESSYKNMKAGKVCAIVGLCLSGIFILYLIVIITFFGSILTAMPWEDIINEIKQH